MTDIVILSTADWDNPYWTNKQHVAAELARLGHRILYVESLGLRRPTASKQDLSRIWRRLKRGLKTPSRVRENIWAWSPLIVPFQRYRLVRAFNRLLLGAMIGFWRRRIGLGDDLLWTYSPLTPSLLDFRRFRTVVYHAVDDIAAQPGMPKQAIETDERRLVREADVVFVTSHALLESHKTVNPNTHYLPNVADFDHFARARGAETTVPDDIARLDRPCIGFVGAISGYKIDFELLRAVSGLRPRWSLVLIGAIGEGDPWTNADALKACTNIHLLGGRPYADLPAYLKGFDVAILPNRLNDYTKAMFPMKFFEYLAAGRPVVATRLPALKDFGGVAAFADDADGFVAAIEAALRGEGAALESRLAVARRYTYAARTAAMLQILALRRSSPERGGTRDPAASPQPPPRSQEA